MRHVFLSFMMRFSYFCRIARAIVLRPQLIIVLLKELPHVVIGSHRLESWEKIKQLLRTSIDSFEEKRYLEQNFRTFLKTLLPKIQKELFKSTYFGIPCIKSPMDFWVYREIIYEIKPDIIIEIGNFRGGHTLALAHFLDNIGHGRVIGLDLDHEGVPQAVKDHPRIQFMTGDACALFPQVKCLVKKGDKVLIIEDSSHTYENTLNVLRAYHSLVSEGSYFIVEDSIVNHGLDMPGELKKGGPYEAIEAFVKENNHFIIDRLKERFVITWNPKGYLKKIK